MIVRTLGGVYPEGYPEVAYVSAVDCDPKREFAVIKAVASG